MLYVGKAKNLKSRVSSYFVKSGHSARIQMMIAQIRRIETTVTQRGRSAAGENNLIKTLEPKYNVVFRDDKELPYLCISGDPFPNCASSAASRTKASILLPVPERVGGARGINTLQKCSSSRTCRENTVFAHRSRPACWRRSAAARRPASTRSARADYQTDVKSAAMFLRGQQDEVTHELNAQMEAAGSFGIREGRPHP